MNNHIHTPGPIHFKRAALLIVLTLFLHGCAGKRVIPPYQQTTVPQPESPSRPAYPSYPGYPPYPSELPAEPGALPDDIPTEQSITIEPVDPVRTIEEPPSQTGAAAALYQTARQALDNSEFQQAEMTMERALRIEPRNGYYWYTMAQIKYRQQDYSQTINLCLKSKSFAGQDLNLVEINDSLIENARQKLVR